MRKPIYIRPLTEDEQHTLQEGLRSSNAFVLRRCQILLASARGQTARVIGEALGCDDQTVRNVLHTFNTQGLAALTRHSSAPRRTPHAAFDAPRREQLRALLHRSPRTFGHATSLWTLALAAKVAYAAGLTHRPISGEAIRRALARLGVRWQRAKHWITSPDPAYLRKKTTRPADGACRHPSHLGARFWRRGLVESPGATRAACLDARRAGRALGRKSTAES